MNLLSRRNLVIGVLAAGAATGYGIYALTPDAAAAVQTGGPAPAFSVQDATGATRTLAEFAGRTVVLEWTNYGCPYVRKHYGAGAMQALQREATSEGVVWLQVISSAPGEQGYLEGPRALVRVRTDDAYPTATLLDPTGVMGHAYGARTTPHMFVINGEGAVVYQGAIDDRPTARPASLDGAHNYVRAALDDIAAGEPVQTPETTPYGCGVKYG